MIVYFYSCWSSSCRGCLCTWSDKTKCIEFPIFFDLTRVGKPLDCSLDSFQSNKEELVIKESIRYFWVKVLFWGSLDNLDSFEKDLWIRLFCLKVLSKYLFLDFLNELIKPETDFPFCCLRMNLSLLLFHLFSIEFLQFSHFFTESKGPSRIEMESTCRYLSE